MAEIGRQAEGEPWPSLEWASWIFDRASVALIISSLIGLLATIAIVWMGIVKEHHWNILRQESNERVAGLEAETAKAKAELGKANAEIARATEGTAQARLETERVRREVAWRRLTKKQYDILQEQLKGKDLFVWTCFVGTDPEATVYRNDLDKALTDAGVKTQYFSGFVMAVGLKIMPGPGFEILTAAFDAAEISYVLADPNQRELATFREKLAIIVGTKPPPF